MEMLQVVGPFVPTGILPKPGLEVLLREVMKSTDLPVDDIIPDPTLEQQLQEAGGGQPQGAPGQPPPQEPGQGAPPGIGQPPPPGGPAPAMVPAGPGQGTGLVVQPDGRSGPAGPIVAAQRQGRA
jgi:hypothetical protein